MDIGNKMTKSLGQEAYELYAQAHSEDGSINPWLNVLPASKQAWHVMANQLADRVINNWLEAEQLCSSEDLYRDANVADLLNEIDCEIGASEITHVSEDGKRAYRYRLVETLHIKERE